MNDNQDGDQNVHSLWVLFFCTNSFLTQFNLNFIYALLLSISHQSLNTLSVTKFVHCAIFHRWTFYFRNHTRVILGIIA